MACGSWKKSTMCVCVPRSRSGRVVFWTSWKESGCASNSGDGVGRSRGRWNRLTAYWASGPAAVAWKYVFGDSGYRFAQPGFVRVRPVEDQPDEPVPAINASRLVESRTLLRVARRQLAETESLLAESFSRLPRFSEEDASRMEARRHDIENKMFELRELIGEQSYDLNSIESKGQTR